MGLVSASKVVPLVSPHGKETKTKKFSQLPAPSQYCRCSHLTTEPRRPQTPDTASCFSFGNSSITGMSHHAQAIDIFLQRSFNEVRALKTDFPRPTY